MPYIEYQVNSSVVRIANEIVVVLYNNHYDGHPICYNMMRYASNGLMNQTVGRCFATAKLCPSPTAVLSVPVNLFLSLAVANCTCYFMSMCPKGLR